MVRASLRVFWVVEVEAVCEILRTSLPSGLVEVPVDLRFGLSRSIRVLSGPVAAVVVERMAAAQERFVSRERNLVGQSCCISC